MIANIHRNTIADAVFVTLPNGDQFAYRGMLVPFDGAAVVFYVHQAATDGPNQFAQMGTVELGDELGLIYDFLSFGGMWNSPVPGVTATWHEIANTASYTSPVDHITYTPGTDTVIVAMRDWLITHDTKACEDATDTRWFRQFLITQKIQPAVNQFLAQIQTPVIPPVFQPPVFPPHQVGRIPSMSDLFIAQAQRLTGVAAGSGVTVGAKPVPT